MWKFSLDFRKKSCFISKNILSKVILKYQVSMSTCTSVYPAIMRTVNPLSQLYISRKLQKYISVSICHCHRRLLRELSLLHLKTMNGVISWYVLALQRLFYFIACVSFLSISLSFFLFCLWSTLLADVLK